MTIGSAPMEGVKRTNPVVVRGQRQGMEALRRDFYTIEVNRGRNYYTYRGFRHIV